MTKTQQQMNLDTSNACGQPDPKEKRWGVRTRVMGSLNLNALGWLPRNPIKRIGDLGTLLRFDMRGYFGKRRKAVPVNIPELVDKWIEAIVGMCLAHDKDTYDAHDAKADELLTPIMAAPVAQVREFYFAMVEKMKTDKRVPFLVKISFEAWGEVIVKNAPDEGVKRLKRKLAADIADLAEMQLCDQWPEAIKRALMWRDPEVLEEVKSRLEAGEKPKIRGRQSCLFLEMGRGKRKVSAML